MGIGDTFKRLICSVGGDLSVSVLLLAGEGVFGWNISSGNGSLSVGEGCDTGHFFQIECAYG